jgi:uncharacterized protein
MEIGKFNLLTVKQVGAKMVQLASSEGEEISIRKKEFSDDIHEGDERNVFIYVDSEGKVTGTTRAPYATVGECAYMKAIQETSFGTFVDWGIEKDLLVPLSRQKEKMKEGSYYLIYVFIDDEHNRITGSTKLNDFISNETLSVKEGKEVNLLLCGDTPLGIKVIVNNKHWGLLYRNEIFKKLKKGDKTKGFIKKIREENKLDVSIQEQGYDEVFSASLIILKKLKEEDGFLPLTDKSEPGTIYHTLQMSKKTFKKAVGALFKDRIISLEEKGIRLIKNK